MNANAVLLHDSLNEEGLRMKIQTLFKMGRHTIAKVTYEHFAKEYENMYDIPYDKEFFEIIS
jgi:hypothetical protein